MRAIKTNIFVRSTGRAIFDLQLPPDIRHGTYSAIVIIEEQPKREKIKRTVRLPNYNTGFLDEQCTFRREQLYGDDER